MLWTGFILGLFGGLHCAGMCGPIALALPGRTRVLDDIVYKSLYNSGRVITYGILGLAAGLIGQSFNVAGWQQGLSLALGSLLIASVIFSGFRNLNVPLVRPVVTITNAIKRYFSYFLKKRSLSSAIGLGMINGLLPCGLVYIALAASIGAGSIESGAFYMLLFGLGTFPVMFFISISGNMVSTGFRQKLYKLVPVFVITLGILFILRGLNLGIPYLSPEIGGSSMISTPVDSCEP